MGNSLSSILITSQCTEWDSYFKILPISVFSFEIACEFLSRNDKHKQSDIKSREELCELLGNHPFALQQAISYVDINKCTFSKYISLFKKSPKMMLDGSPVLATIQIAPK